MLEIDFYDDQERLLGSMFGETELPNGVSEIKIKGLRDTNNSFQTLLKMLKHSEAKLKKVAVEDIQEISTGIMAFLFWIPSKTSELAVRKCKLGDSGFGCLMSGVLQPKGLTKLELTTNAENPRITKHQATLLFEAVASSSSLEVLLISAQFEEFNEVGTILLHYLRRNRSLTGLGLEMNFLGEEFVIGSLIQATVLQTKVQTLAMGHSGETLLRPMSIDDLADVVCRKDCSLLRLGLTNILPVSRNNPKAPTVEKNSSVTYLFLTGMDIALPELISTIHLFDSLKRLSLDDCSISDLTPLDKLLLGGKESTLEHLELTGNPINEQDLKIFLRKVPRMRSLRCLEMDRVIALSDSEACVTALKDAAWRNTSLERVYYYSGGHPPYGQLDSMIKLATTLNRGGQRKFLDSYPITLPQQLWPYVLKRSMAIKYYANRDDWGSPTLTSGPSLDVVFWLLQQKMHF